MYTNASSDLQIPHILAYGKNSDVKWWTVYTVIRMKSDGKSLAEIGVTEKTAPSESNNS
jgi:hypothetical protein